MAIVEIVLYLQVTAASRGRIIVLVLQNALDASLLVSMIYLTRLVRTLKNANTASPGIMTTTVQTTQPVAPRPPELSAQTHPQTSVAGAVHPVPVHEVPAYNTYAHPNLTPQQRAELEALPRSQSPGQWIFVPNGTFPQDGQVQAGSDIQSEEAEL
ncbi:predicted protein [Aspergillus nidulans FGSC A4]|uniref:Uncharacterized protein n=1 Tax=Emericella nidulans (strain FGSC A4 / ATCC 38163 / CBS 112.46 / NRRL 194 / M139) TaxID=227321 RepID=Q5AZX7_EMENI|nr:hypothetical protein [Aspergillus nidulans FGSC A4]EAA57939.1 predicted protein [Aspergillus nidulans FGSC A4]CBF70078.1 TPA: conserved hypothetical protein [Aspergillus nidulans FGSC A4]|eukprot:XP_663757.1 predicted protein [Aspergillus nidulans FGSC A4]